MHIADQLHAAGLPVFPCRQDKAPAVPRGVDWRTEAQRPPAQQHWPTGVVGIPIPAGCVVIDLDTYKGVTREQVEQLLGCTLPWDAALIQHTQRGGQHYAFRVDGWDVRQGSDIAGVAGFDTRCVGVGYIATGSGYTAAGFGVYALLHPAALPRLPEAARTVLERVAPAEPTATRLPSDTDSETILQALAHIDPACSRSEWLKVGLALRSHYGEDPEGEGFAVFDRWSAGELTGGECPENYNVDGQQHQWGSFKADGATTLGSLFYAAVQGGWSPPAGIDTAAAFGGGAVAADVFDALVDRIHEHGADARHTDQLSRDIIGTQCSLMQRAALLALLSRELKEAGLLTKDVRDQLGKAAGTPYVSRVPQTPSGQILPAHQPLHPDNWAAFHTKGKDSKPLGTQDNFEIMMRAYGANIRFNEISKEMDIAAPGLDVSGTLGQEAALSHLDHLANLNHYPKADLPAMIRGVANRHTYNPVIDWLNSAPWDGRDHITALLQCLTLDPDEDPVMAEMLFRKWLRGAVAIGTGRTRKMEYVLTLVDPKGGTGKTRFFSSLCLPELRKDGVILDAANKDSLKIATSYWLIELGELDGTFNRSERGKLKAFLSEEVDEIRLPYARAYTKYPRRTAFFASVNDEKFLVDDSGNRRFWPIRVTAVNHEHQLDMQQVWAQVLDEVNRGAGWYLTPEENDAVAIRNEDFKTCSRVVEALDGLYADYNGEECEKHMSRKELLDAAGVFHGTGSDLKEAGNWAKRKGFVAHKRNGKRGFMMPEFVTPTSAAFKPTLVK